PGRAAVCSQGYYRVETAVLRKFYPAYVRVGSSAPFSESPLVVCLAPETHRKSGHAGSAVQCQFRTHSLSKGAPYSITSSARPSRGSGTLMPSALAVLRLMYSSTLVACWTGRSAGLSPLRIRPVIDAGQVV